MEDLSGSWGRFSLTEKEDVPFDFGIDEDTQFYLAARFMTGRLLNIESIVRTFRPLWRTVRGFTARDMGHNLVVFAFEDATDLERVLQGEPWSYDKHLVSFQRVDVDTDVKEMECGFVSFWVQIHNLPVGRMKRELALALGAAVGEVEHVGETEEEKGCEGYMRVRVKIDIAKPLCRGRKAQLPSGKETWISFKYERLPIFCYWCGCLTHGDKDCDVWMRNKGTMIRAEQQYGAWLRATAEKPVRCIEVKVAGRSNVPRWGKPANGENPVTPATHANDDQVNAPVLENEDIQDPLPPSRKTGEDFESELRKIDEALNFAPPYLEVLNKERRVDSVPLTRELRETNNKENPNLENDVVDKEIEDLRNRVVLQDILGSNDRDGNKSYSRKKNSGKENIPCNGGQCNMVEVQVKGESRAGWKWLPREKDLGTAEAICKPLLGAKRGGSWVDGQNVTTSGKKKGKGAVEMEGVEVVGGSAEAVQQPRRTQ